MDDDLIEWAHACALHALDDSERRDLDARLAEADEATRAEFDAAVRLARETMAAASSLVAVTPPASLRHNLIRQVTGDELAARRTPGRRWRIAIASVAAAVALLAGGVVIGHQITETPPTPSVTAQILDAPDMHSVTAEIPGGGTATTMYSKDANAAMLVMNGVTPPKSDTVYQMWLVRGDEPVPAGTMGPDQVSPTTTAVLEGIDGATQLGFTVEPPGGSTSPTGDMFASIPLT
ncbi:anti-sigma factor [Rhodococcus sp. TAF43]|uniref:anti-sigma factor n=1 Tax=unclassified Rhodococcus (in: high G+C Gram-positive bacteria) TaxID=192944 RepID=UPI000E0AE86B|nr:MULTISPECIES: anti-sigma factor [unclassified Rhodococcus (in: high G+C Gram-positive bacteria)]QKT12689.1 anti-sigma factor [Rhodococcus sp. W8901]RDI34059.1 anti-sigma-K factor RskA [Rhodococcus sp. AG1013]